MWVRFRSGPFALALCIAQQAMSGCGARWETGPSVVATPGRVAEALGDREADHDVDPEDIPEIDMPEHLRRCCAFGADLRAQLGDVPVPLFVLGNIIEPGELGRHLYGVRGGQLETENDGLVYTCRGGWIDTAHVRETADHVLFFALRLARSLPHGDRFEFPGDGSERTFVFDPIDPAIIERYGRLEVATMIAEWTAFEISRFHELATWFGWQSTLGFSEKPSAFSLEDFYSNALGIRIGSAIVRDRGFHTEEEYNRTMDAWLSEALARLRAQPKDVSRQIMYALDGRWWDSQKRVPDPLLVLRRMFPEDMPIGPWRIEDAYGPEELPAAIAERCSQFGPRTLDVRDHLGPLRASDVVHVEWRPESWADESLPYPREEKVIRLTDVPALTAVAHEQMKALLGDDFDQPRAPARTTLD